jgi:prepilin-type processing-associated H-X9-DG protein
MRWEHSRYLKAGASDYAMNTYAELCGTSGPPDLVLVFESRPGWNRAGGPEALTTEHHDGAGCNVLFLGGHVDFIHAQELARLRWKPS